MRRLIRAALASGTCWALLHFSAPYITDAQRGGILLFGLVCVVVAMVAVHRLKSTAHPTQIAWATQQVSRIAADMGVPAPRVVYRHDTNRLFNAFHGLGVTGRVVNLDDEVWRLRNPHAELLAPRACPAAGIIAHEIAHTPHVTGTLGTLFTRTLAWGLRLHILINAVLGDAPIIAVAFAVGSVPAVRIVNAFISRMNEREADAAAAAAGYGPALAAALSSAPAGQRGAGNPLKRLFSTHPPVDERVKALRATTSGRAPSPIR
jgi:hypothetical protein